LCSSSSSLQQRANLRIQTKSGDLQQILVVFKELQLLL